VKKHACLHIWDVCSYNNENIWTWNTHGKDWIYEVPLRFLSPQIFFLFYGAFACLNTCHSHYAWHQGGPDSTLVKNDPSFNQWEDLDDSPVAFHTTAPVDPMSVDSWLSKVGGGLY